MDSIYWALMLSFLAGALGYIIVRFWIIPIFRYRRIKNALLSILKDYVKKLPSYGQQPQKGLSAKKRLRDIQKLSTQLLEVHDLELPYWYRLVLMTRNESPKSAAEAIASLENLSVGTKVRNSIDAVGKYLGVVL